MKIARICVCVSLVLMLNTLVGVSANADPAAGDEFAKRESVRLGFPEMTFGACFGFVCDYILKTQKPSWYKDMCEPYKGNIDLYTKTMSSLSPSYPAAMDYMAFNGLWAATLMPLKGNHEELVRLAKEVCMPAIRMMPK